jgi:hypothetical protein
MKKAGFGPPFLCLEYGETSQPFERGKTPQSSSTAKPSTLEYGETPQPVIPAKAGVHFDLRAKAKWIPAFAGMTKSPSSPRRRGPSAFRLA